MTDDPDLPTLFADRRHHAFVRRLELHLPTGWS
jgi:hypothetical protein